MKGTDEMSSQSVVKPKKRFSCDAADITISFQQNSMRDAKDININKTKAKIASNNRLKATFPCANPIIWMHLSGGKVPVVSFRFCSPTQVIAESDGTTSCISIETYSVTLDQGQRQRDRHLVGRVT